MKRHLFDLHAELEQRHWWFVARRQIVAALLGRVVPPGPGSLIIDVGCGTGANIAGLSPAYECVGVDTSADAVRFARQRFPGIRFIRGAAPADVLAEMTRAAAVTLMDVLEHVPDDFALLSSLLAPLPAGAHLLVTVPADEGLWSEHDESFGHYRRYSPERLAATWRGLPVRARLLSPFNARLYPFVKAVRLVAQVRGRASGRGGTDLRLPPRPANRLVQRLFAGETARLERVLAGRGRPYARGVSLIAILQREPGVIEPRSRPEHVAADRHAPAAVRA